MEIGDYVRTKDGFIAKLVSKNDYLKKYCFDNYIWEKGHIPISDISYQLLDKHIREDIKPSPNIINLLEKGDIITTNNLCGEITNIKDGKIYTTCYDGEYCSQNDIKTIVTKERFKEMEYKL